MTRSVWAASWTCSRGSRCRWCSPLHPRTDARLRGAGLHDRLAQAPGVTLTEPLGYFELSALLCNARAAVTDSGGLQKEAYLAGCPASPCVPTPSGPRRWSWAGTCSPTSTPRASWPPWRREPPTVAPPLYGDGHAGERVVEALAGLAA